MSSPISLVFPDLPPLPDWPPKAPIEKLKVFYQPERTLFTRLVFVLNRDISQSVQVIGFLLMLGLKDYAGILAVQLIELPDSYIDMVANEISFCLNVLYHKDFLSSLSLGPNHDYDRSVIPRTVQLTEGKFGLNEINEKREALIAGMNEVLNDCTRAFEDLAEKAERRNMEKFLALKSLASASSL